MKLIKSKLTAVFLMACILMFPAFGLALPTTSLEMSDMDIMIGETFGINVVANGVEFPNEVLAFGFDLNFNPVEFSFAGWNPGPDFLDDTLLVPLEIAGSVRVFDDMGMPLPPVSGDNILLASLFFTAEMAGDFQIGILSDLLSLDPEIALNSGLITLGAEPVDMTQSIDVNVVPEPATIILMASGMAGLGLFSRRWRKSKV